MKVALCEDSSLWDAYVETSAHASNYHRWIWKRVIEETFGHTGFYLTATTDGGIRGVLPLIAIVSRLFGHFMVSVPFFSHGGVLADTDEARSSLLAKAEQLGRELGMRYIELRQDGECELVWRAERSKVVMGLPLPASEDELFGSFPGKLRNRIRHSEKQGFELRVGGIEAVRDFYSIFAVNMRHLGTPVYPRRWFENICSRVPDCVRILTAWKGNQATASVFVIGFRDTLEVPWSATLPDSRKMGSAVWLEWKMLEWAVKNGYRWMDLGRSTPGSGSYMFKRQWTKHERPLHCYYWLASGAALPHLRQENPRYRWATKVWQRLPLALTNRLGPRIVCSIP
jgi:FemAB-related protein (PEP-CTERM system-associated)